jgi:hypothetical protein
VTDTAPGTPPRTRRGEDGSISLLILGFAIIATLLIAGATAVTSAHLSRMRLLDVADGAALSAANALDDQTYVGGVGESVPLSNLSVQERAAAYLSSRPRPDDVSEWRLAPGTGTRDGRTAVVVVVGKAELPMIGPALRDLGVSITIRVESRARSDVVG